MRRETGSETITSIAHGIAGPARRLGWIAAAAALVLDQASKLWLLRSFDLPGKGQVSLFPWLDLVMAWNRGVSYSLLTASTETGRWLLVAGTLAATILLCVWLSRTHSALTALAVGLLIGGAVGNLVDRIAYGAVVDFVFFHVGGFRWYVFNIADCAIVAGVALLLFGMIRPEPAREGPA